MVFPKDAPGGGLSAGYYPTLKADEAEAKVAAELGGFSSSTPPRTVASAATDGLSPPAEASGLPKKPRRATQEGHAKKPASEQKTSGGQEPAVQEAA